MTRRLVVLSYTVWLAIWRHEMASVNSSRRLRAAARYVRKHAIRQRTTQVVVALPCPPCRGSALGRHRSRVSRIFRYHPRWAWWLTSVPVREFLVNLVLVLTP